MSIQWLALHPGSVGDWPSSVSSPLGGKFSELWGRRVEEEGLILGLQQLNIQHKQRLGMRSLLFWEPKGKHSCICSCNHGPVWDCLYLEIHVGIFISWSTETNSGYLSQKRIPLEGYQAAPRVEGKEWIVHDLASEKKLDSSGVLNVRQLRDSLFSIHIGMNGQQLFSILTFFPWRFKFLEERVSWVILPIHLPEGGDCKQPRSIVPVDAGKADTTDVHPWPWTDGVFLRLPTS